MKFLAVTPDPGNPSTGEVSIHSFKEGVEHYLTRVRPGRFILVLTAPEKVKRLVELVRLEVGQERLAGCLPDHEWLLPVLEFVVASPQPNLPSQLLAALIDAETFHPDVVHGLFPWLPCESRPLHTPLYRQRWFSYQRRAACSIEFQELLASQLPEAALCPGWGDETFTRMMSSFSNRNHSVVCQDWSGLVALIAGLVRHAFTTSGPPPLLVVPENRLGALTLLVQGCAREMGICEERRSKIGAVISVESFGSLELLAPLSRSGSRLVVVEANSLFDDQTLGWKKFVGEFDEHGPVGMHITRMTDALSQVVRRMKVASLPGVSMEGVSQFVAVVKSEEEKLDVVCRLWEQLQRSSPRHYTVFCNSAEKVEQVVSGLVQRGYEAYPVLSQDDDDTMLERAYDHGFSLIITNVYKRASQDVINLELPLSDEEYVSRVGRERSDVRRIKMVLNIGFIEELSSLSAFQSMVPLPSEWSKTSESLRNKLLVLSAPYLIRDMYNNTI